ncbi:MAG TPA: aquaporin [Xanthobacteraceae bacterium]|nr:aquaporin [Xanthobacteraceae bacterium]
MNYLNDKRLLCELIGTATLILVGCGAVTIGGFGSAFPVGILPVALAFGLTVMAMAYAIGPVSGCHINPAVTAAMWAAGRTNGADAISYVVAQVIGGILGAAILVVILKGKIAGYDVMAAGLGQNGWGAGYLGGFGLTSAMLTELVATFLFTLVILGATSQKGATPVAGLIIGLTLVVLHFPFINVTGLSVNPARSLGPAVFVGANALAQVWLFLVFPTLGGLAAGWLVKSKTLDI